MSPPPATMMASAPRRSASPRAAASAEPSPQATIAPGAVKPRSRLTTMVVRPFSGCSSDWNVLRPMITGLPMVTWRKCCMSDLSRHGSRLSRPITPFSAIATMRTRGIGCTVSAMRRTSHRDLGLDARVRIVGLERKVLVAEGEQVGDRRIEAHARQGSGRALELQPRLLEMVQVEVGVAEGVDKLAWLEAGHLRHHQRQQRIGGDVERHA